MIPLSPICYLLSSSIKHITIPTGLLQMQDISICQFLHSQDQDRVQTWHKNSLVAFFWQAPLCYNRSGNQDIPLWRPRIIKTSLTQRFMVHEPVCCSCFSHSVYQEQQVLEIGNILFPLSNCLDRTRKPVKTAEKNRLRYLQNTLRQMR